MGMRAEHEVGPGVDQPLHRLPLLGAWDGLVLLADMERERDKVHLGVVLGGANLGLQLVDVLERVHHVGLRGVGVVAVEGVGRVEPREAHVARLDPRRLANGVGLAMEAGHGKARGLLGQIRKLIENRLRALVAHMVGGGGDEVEARLHEGLGKGGRRGKLRVGACPRGILHKHGLLRERRQVKAGDVVGDMGIDPREVERVALGIIARGIDALVDDVVSRNAERRRGDVGGSVRRRGGCLRICAYLHICI